MKQISMDLVRVTEAAAISASAWVGSGNKEEADRAATDAMRDRLNQLPMHGVIRIGEGKKDGAPGLFRGEIVGGLRDMAVDLHVPSLDIAVDPIDGTRQTTIAGPEAISVLAVADHNTMFHTDDFYMLKLAYGPEIATRTTLNVDAPLKDTLGRVAKAIYKQIEKLTVCILDRPRHAEYIDEMRRCGCRIKLIQDCDISGAIATCLPDSGVDLLFGIGGAPEAVITACAMKCLGGNMDCLIWDQKSGEQTGYARGQPYTLKHLVDGNCCFAATGVTNGSLLKGVRWTQHGPITNSVFMRSESGTVRWLITEHGN